MSGNRGRTSITILITGLATVISYLINLLLTPYLTRTLGIEAYGFVSIAKNAVSYATILTVALTSFIVRFISVSYHAGRIEEARGYYASSVAASVLLAGILFVLALPVISRLERVLHISAHLVKAVKILFVIIFLNFVFTTVTTSFTAAFYIKNRLNISGIIRIAAYVFDAAVLFVLFSCFRPAVWYVGIGSLSATLVIMVCSYAMTRKLTPQLRFRREWVSWRRVKDLMRNGVWNSMNSLGNTLNSGLDLLITNLLLSNVAMGQIAVVKTLNTMFTTLYQVIFQPFQPELIKSYAEGNTEHFVKKLKKVMLICGCFASVAFAGFFALGEAYYQLWLPEENTRLLYELTLVTVVISLTEGIMQPIYYVSTLTLKNRLPCFITIAGGLANVGSMYLLLKHTSLGAFAVVGTTTVIMLCINLFFNPVFAARCLGIPSAPIYAVICRHFLAAGTITVMLYAMGQVLRPETWLGFFASAVLLAVMGITVYALFSVKKEDIVSFVNKCIHSLKNRKSHKA